MYVLFTLTIIIILALLLRNTSSYTATTPTADRYALPVNIGKKMYFSDNSYWTESSGDFEYGTSEEGSLSWDELNKLVWTKTNTTYGITRSCTGFRKVLKAGGGGQVAWLFKPVVNDNGSLISGAWANSPDAGVLAEVDVGGTLYDIPDMIIAIKSVANPLQARSCIWNTTYGTSCSATTCWMIGYFTDTINITVPAVAEGTCQYTNGQTVRNRQCTKITGCSLL
jgi:hypothetical protein